MKPYADYIKEIEELKKKYKLDAYQVLMLNIASAFKVDNITYDKLKKEYCKE